MYNISYEELYIIYSGYIMSSYAKQETNMHILLLRGTHLAANVKHTSKINAVACAILCYGATNFSASARRPYKVVAATQAFAPY